MEIKYVNGEYIAIPKIYLAGNITPNSYEWRLEYTSKLLSIFPKGVIIWDPEKFETIYEDSNDKVNTDLNLISQCDILLANITERSVGTSMEIFAANRLYNKLVVLRCPDKLNHPWFIAHATRIFPQFPQVLRYLKGYSNQMKPLITG